MEKDIYHTNNNQNKKTGVAILVSDTTDIKKKLLLETEKDILQQRANQQKLY